MLTLFIIVAVLMISNTQSLDISKDAQIIVLAICVASDLNILKGNRKS